MSAVTTTEECQNPTGTYVTFDIGSDPILAVAHVPLRSEREEAHEVGTDTDSLTQLKRWYEEARSQSHEFPSVSFEAALVCSACEHRDFCDVGRTRGKSRSSFGYLACPRIAWSYVPKRLYLRLLDRAWGLGFTRGLVSGAAQIDSRSIMPVLEKPGGSIPKSAYRATIEPDVRLVPPPERVRRIKVRFRMVGREEPRIHFDPDRD